MLTDRYARQQLIEGWDQERLRRSRVVVAGVGALGNEVAKNLALLGVGFILLIDFDQIDLSNLSRTVLFQTSEVGLPKVESAAKALARLNPEVALRTINGDLFYDVGLGFYRHSDLVIGCLDNLAARSRVGLSCALAGVPYLDGGMWSLGGEARWFMAGDGPCFDCTLTPDDRARAEERRSCTGFRAAPSGEPRPVPTVATTASIIGGLLAQEAVKYLSGHSITAGRAIVYNGQALSLHRAELARNPACPSGHHPYAEVVELPHRAADLSARRLLAIASADARQRRDQKREPSGWAGDEVLVELGRDFLLALDCPACGLHADVNRPWGRVPEDEQVCPRCGAARRAEVIRAVGETNPEADRPLAQLGVPPGEVLAVRTPAGLRFYELTADVVGPGLSQENIAMESIKQFSVAEKFDYEALLDEAIETVIAANVELGPEQRKADANLQEAAESLRRLKKAQASFSPSLTIQPLTPREFTARGLEPAPDVKQWMKTHRFYLVQVPVTLRPVAGWAFTRLECWVGFEAGRKGQSPPQIHDLCPDDVWVEILGLKTQLRLGLDEALKFKAGLAGSQNVYQSLSGEAQARVAVEAAGGARLVVGPFAYSVSRRQVSGRGRENSEVFWHLDGQEYVEKEEPYLALVLRVPESLNVVNASGELIAYQQFDFLGAHLKDWEGSFRDKLKSFFSRGLPLENTASWKNILPA
jgi:adenylyltransferase/sulfurtransferase